MSITQFCYDRHDEWNTPNALRTLLIAGGFTECKVPLDVEFKHAYDLAADLVGPEHFMVVSRNSIWFESDTIAIQYRLSL